MFGKNPFKSISPWGDHKWLHYNWLFNMPTHVIHTSVRAIKQWHPFVWEIVNANTTHHAKFIWNGNLKTAHLFCLAHLHLNKMATISQTTVSKHFHEWQSFISIWISLRFVPKGPVDNKAALAQVMAWHRTGDEPFSEPMLTKFTYTYLWH